MLMLLIFVTLDISVANAQDIESEKDKKNEVLVTDLISFEKNIDDTDNVYKLQGNDELNFLNQNYQVTNETFDSEVYPSSSLLNVSVYRYFTYLWQIPDSIYYNSNGYTGYIPKTYQFRDAGDLYYTVVYAGVVFRNGPGVN